MLIFSFVCTNMRLESGKKIGHNNISYANYFLDTHY